MRAIRLDCDNVFCWSQKRNELWPVVLDKSGSWRRCHRKSRCWKSWSSREWWVWISHTLCTDEGNQDCQQQPHRFQLFFGEPAIARFRVMFLVNQLIHLYNIQQPFSYLLLFAKNYFLRNFINLASSWASLSSAVWSTPKPPLGETILVVSIEDRLIEKVNIEMNWI